MPTSLPKWRDHFKNIYLYIPPRYKTGGVEAICQLCDALFRCGVETFVYPWGEDAQSIPLDYRTKYKLRIADSIVDSAETLIIFYETICDHELQRYPHSHKAIWWLSVDNSYVYQRMNLSCAKGPALYWKVRNYFRYRQIKRRYSRCLHLYQSAYARTWVRSSFDIPDSQLIPVYDYLSDEVIAADNSSWPARSTYQVAYNPRKGFELTKSIIETAQRQYPHLRFKPLENLDARGVSDLLRSSGLYVDFGNHPGTDRIPREAAINGCCVLTGRQGSAANNEDVPIPDKYKLDERKNSVQEIVEQIAFICEHYEECTKDFDHYRGIIHNQKAQFMDQVQVFVDCFINQDKN